MIDLQGRVALVSGSASGIGEATAAMLAEASASVIVADVNEEGANRVAEEIRATGAAAIAHRVDISDETSVRELFAAVESRFGRLDILDNNAALVTKDHVEADLDVQTIALATWDRSFAVNARGTMLMAQRALPLMLASGGGSIINVASLSALWGDVRSTAYGCSKASVVALTRYIAAQHLQDGIRCNAIAPGLVITPASRAATLNSESGGGPLLLAMERHQSRSGEPRDIAGVVLFLASDLSAFITGQVITVDGGLFMHTPVLPERVASAHVVREAKDNTS